MFTLEQARAAGITSSALRHARSRGRLHRPRRGVYAVPSTDPARALVQSDLAAALAVTGATLSHLSAARWLGMPTLRPSPPCITLPSSTGREHPGVHVHRASLAVAGHLTHFGAIDVTSPARTVVDLGREHGIDAAVVAGDFALRAGLTTASELLAVIDQCAGWPGVVAARNALALLDRRSESPLESLSRIRLAACGLAEPDLQAEISDEHGAFAARVDFLFDGRVIGEADGMNKYSSPDVLHAEKMRQERLERLGYVVVRWMWHDITRMDVVAARIRRALARSTATPVTFPAATALRVTRS